VEPKRRDRRGKAHESPGLDSRKRAKEKDDKQSFCRALGEPPLVEKKWYRGVSKTMKAKHFK